MDTNGLPRKTLLELDIEVAALRATSVLLSLTSGCHFVRTFHHICAQIYAQVLNKFNEVRCACFGKTLAQDYRKKIADFKIWYFKLSLSVTPKFHIVFDHVPQCCSKYKKGLGWASEQAFEAIHRDFYEIYKNYKMATFFPRNSSKLLLRTTATMFKKLIYKNYIYIYTN